jgi:hypothetical protein
MIISGGGLVLNLWKNNTEAFYWLGSSASYPPDAITSLGIFDSAAKQLTIAQDPADGSYLIVLNDLAAEAGGAAATWITQNIAQSPRLAATPLGKFVMPAAHDAGASVVTAATRLANAGNSVTQSGNVLAQLNAGARFLDLRPILWSSRLGPDIYLGHFSYALKTKFVGIAGQLLSTALQNVSQFLAQPGGESEFVILYFSHWYNIDVDGSEPSSAVHFPMPSLLSQLTTALGSRLFTLPSFSNPTASANLASLPISQFAGKAVAVFDGLPAQQNGAPFYRDPTKGFFSYLKQGSAPLTDPPAPAWQDMAVVDSYAETDDYDDMVGDQAGKLTRYAGISDAMFLLSWTLSLPAYKAGLGNTIVAIARPADAALLPWILEQIELDAITTAKFPNFIYCDFVESQYGLADAAMAINNMLLAAS